MALGFSEKTLQVDFNCVAQIMESLVWPRAVNANCRKGGKLQQKRQPNENVDWMEILDFSFSFLHCDIE